MNFIKVIHMAIRYRLTFISSIACALIVAVFWGGNIGAVYPIVEVVFEGESPQQWIDRQIRDTQKTIDAKTEEISTLEKQLAQANEQDKWELQYKINSDKTTLKDRNFAKYWLDTAKPYIDQYLPESPFKFLTLIVLLLIIGTIFKDMFLISNSILVARMSQLATFDLRKLFYRRTLRMDLATFSDDGTPT